MVITTNNDERILWLDWMKVWAILAIIWGHFFSKGHVYLYVFNVQVFCVISGFLYKRSSNLILCIKKCFWQLLIPTIIMSIMILLESHFRYLLIGKDLNIPWLSFSKGLLMGAHWCMGPCWYFYTLMVMRFFLQFVPEKKWLYAILFITFSVGAIIWNKTDMKTTNAIVNVLVCMPFFLIGVLMKPLGKVCTGLHNHFIEILLVISAIFLIILCGHYNSYVWMYQCKFGNYFILFISGGLAGTILLFIISLWLSRFHFSNMTKTISKGSILIIGLHIVMVRRLIELPSRMWYEDLIASILILFCFLPIIRLAEIFCPLLLGKHTS